MAPMRRCDGLTLALRASGTSEALLGRKFYSGGVSACPRCRFISCELVNLHRRPNFISDCPERYNSAFFTTLSTNEYNVLYATESFVSGGSYDTRKFQD